jgi:hypothetical protein
MSVELVLFVDADEPELDSEPEPDPLSNPSSAAQDATAKSVAHTNSKHKILFVNFVNFILVPR